MNHERYFSYDTQIKTFKVPIIREHTHSHKHNIKHSTDSPGKMQWFFSISALPSKERMPRSKTCLCTSVCLFSLFFIMSFSVSSVKCCSVPRTFEIKGWSRVSKIKSHIKHACFDPTQLHMVIVQLSSLTNNMVAHFIKAIIGCVFVWMIQFVNHTKSCNGNEMPILRRVSTTRQNLCNWCSF